MTLIESVSVSSYISLLGKLKDSAYLKVYSSVLAVEARHSSFIRGNLGEQPFPSPFDTPLDLDETYTLIELFTVSCPKDNPLSLKVCKKHLLSQHSKTQTANVCSRSQNFPTLSSSYSNHGVIGTEVTFVTYGQDIKLNSDSDPLYAAFLTLAGPVFATYVPLSLSLSFQNLLPSKINPFSNRTTRLPDNGGFNVTVPASPTGYPPINGLTYVVLSSSNTILTDQNIVAGPASIEIFLQ